MFQINFSTPKQKNLRISENFSLSASRISFSTNTSMKIQAGRRSLTPAAPSKPNEMRKSLSNSSAVDDGLLKILASQPDNPLYEDVLEDETEQTAMNESDIRPKENPVMAKILRDLNSPSAMAQTRARRALRYKKQLLINPGS